MKTQIFQLLSALCLFSDEGNEAVLEALQNYKVKKKKVKMGVTTFDSLAKERASLSIQLAFARAEISRDGRILGLRSRIDQLLA